MKVIDESWYTKPPGIRERQTSGGVVVRVSNGDVLVALAREKSIEEFVLPKGGVEPGEEILEAAIREIHEETGLMELQLLGKLDVLERLSYQKHIWLVIHYFLFITEQVDATPADSQWHSGMWWHPIGDLPEFLWPEQRDLIRRNQQEIIDRALTLSNS